MASSKESKEGGMESAPDEVHAALADLGPELPRSMRRLAEDLPEKDEVQVAIKEGMLAEDMAVTAEQKAKVVEASPNASETPSGAALLAVRDISHDADRGEAYSAAKSAVRHGYVPGSAAPKVAEAAADAVKDAQDDKNDGK
jgi:hypothetical protein